MSRQGRRKRRRFRDDKLDIMVESCDGLEVNGLNRNQKVGRKGWSMSMFDTDHIMIEIDGILKSVGVLNNVHRINWQKTTNISKYKKLINGRE